MGALILNAYNGGIIITTSSLSEEAPEEVRPIREYHGYRWTRSQADVEGF
ncbi:MAG: hypothetical protein DRO36_05720 [Candidatus Hecatellales archaeon]|nr:MAG: hypothetical protein DRO36_05720 [Candidatus Hecatellales archaeon]